MNVLYKSNAKKSLFSITNCENKWTNQIEFNQLQNYKTSIYPITHKNNLILNNLRMVLINSNSKKKQNNIRVL